MYIYIQNEKIKVSEKGEKHVFYFYFYIPFKL